MKISKEERAKIEKYIAELGGEDFRIDADDAVHIYGKMLNGIERGWYNAGHVEYFLWIVNDEGI